MIWFEYKYTTSSEILNNLKLLIDYSLIEYFILVFCILLMFLIIYYIVPIINIYFEFLNKEKQIFKRKQMIKQIALQKDINDEIEKELNI